LAKGPCRTLTIFWINRRKSDQPLEDAIWQRGSVVHSQYFGLTGVSLETITNEIGFSTAQLPLDHNDFITTPDRVGLFWVKDNATDVYSGDFSIESQLEYTTF
jgi:hypothetical protein